MFDILKISFKIDIAYAFNSIIYIFSKLPFFKDVINYDTYNNFILKKIIGFVAIVLTCLRLILYRLMYFGSIYLLAKFINNQYLNSSFVFIYIIFAFIGLVINVNLLSASRKKYFSIILFRMDAKRYMISDLLFGLLISFVLNFVSFLFCSMFIDFSFFTIISLCLLSLFCRVVGEAISIYFYNKFQYLLTSKYKLTFSYVLLLLASCFLCKIGFYVSSNILFLILFIMFIFVIKSFYYILSFNNYKAIYKKINTDKTAMNDKNSDVYMRQMMVEIKNKDKVIDEKKLTGKHGYDLFNTIFFERHKEILLRSSKNYSLICAVFIFLTIILFKVFPGFSTELNKMLHQKIGIFVIIMYFINRGSIVTQAMFYNCDHAMLTFNFYKNAVVILNLFKKRLFMIIKINLLPAFVIAFGTIVLLYFSGGTIFINYIMIPLFIILLSIFFSVHYLVIYYLLQPFNKNLEIKKVSYSFVSMITYFISYTIIDVKMSSLLFSTLGLVFTTFYIFISLFLVYKYAPKTFRINN